MKHIFSRKRNKVFAFLLSICVMLTSMVMLPERAYAADTDTVLTVRTMDTSQSFAIYKSDVGDIYYKNDGTRGTANDYNYYYNGSKLYLKNAECDQIMLRADQDYYVEFIGESIIDDFFLENGRLYIEGTTNSKINIGSVGLYSNQQDSYIGINNADITINAEVDYGISAGEVELSNSNVKISAPVIGIHAMKGTVRNTTLDITSSVGIAGLNLSVAGGKLSVDAVDVGIYVEEYAGYDGDSGIVALRGGTYQIQNATIGVLSPTLMITGGSIFTNAMYTDVSKTEPLVPTKADKITPVYLTTVVIDGITSSKKLTSLTTSDKTYTADDIYTDAAGKIYLYLPAGAIVTGAAIEDTEYTGTVTATAEGSTGTLKKAVRNVSAATISGIENKTYTGKSITQNMRVTFGGKTLVKDTDYTVSYGNNINPGTATVTIKGKGNYQGTTQKTFKISAPVLAAPKTVSAQLYGYDDIQVSWTKVSGATGYKVYYKKSTAKNYSSKTTTKTSLKLPNLSDGVKYNIKVVAYKTVNKVNYEGKAKTASAIYTLEKLSTPKVSKKSANKVTVKWTNINGETGYQISKSTSKTKTSIVETMKTTTGKSKVLSAKKGKTYYYKVRAYKTVGKTKIVGPWSNVKAYKVK